MTAYSLGFSCPPIKGFTGLTILGKLCADVVFKPSGGPGGAGGKDPLTGYQAPAATRVVVPGLLGSFGLKGILGRWWPLG